MGEVITGEVYQILNWQVLLIDGEGNELNLPKSEQIDKDKYRKGRLGESHHRPRGDCQWQPQDHTL